MSDDGAVGVFHKTSVDITSANREAGRIFDKLAVFVMSDDGSLGIFDKVAFFIIMAFNEVT